MKFTEVSWNCPHRPAILLYSWHTHCYEQLIAALLPDAEMHEIRRHAARERPGHELHVLVLLQS